MGIRVHKMIGYGLTDVQVDDDGYSLTDERINANSILLDYDHEDKANIDAYHQFVKQLPYKVPMAGISTYHDRLPRSEPFNCVVHEAEYGLRNVLCIRPVGTAQWGWYRNDDTMDYMEESSVHDQKDRVQVFKQGVYPFGGYMNAQTGTSLPASIYDWVRANNRDKRSKDRSTLDMLAEIGGFKNHAEARRLVVPIVPPEIRALADFGNLFTSDDVWKQLRPMIYVYWG